MAAEELGADGAFFRVHHFARQLASPVPPARRGRRAHEPHRDRHRRDRHALREPALHGRGRRRRRPDRRAAGCSWGSAAGHRSRSSRATATSATSRPRAATTRSWRARHTEVFLSVIDGARFAEPNPRPMFPNPPGMLGHRAAVARTARRGSGGVRRPNATGQWTAEQGMNLMSSTLKWDESGKPFHEQQAEQIQVYRDAWRAAGHAREPRVSVSRSIFAAGHRPGPGLLRAGPRHPRPARVHRHVDPRDLRALLRGRARRAGRAARRRHGDRRGRHAACSPCPTSWGWTTTPICSSRS